VSLFTELKRRNVFRVAVAYVVASWLLLQIADVLMGVLGLPASVGKIVFLVLAIGFLPALVFAWAFEITPEGIKRDADVEGKPAIAHHAARRLDTAVIVMLVAVAALVVWDRLAPEHEPETLQPTSTEAAPEPVFETRETVGDGKPVVESALSRTAVDGRTSIAVLPFVNMSPDADNEYFADGISEELLNVLVELDGLRVPSRTSSFAFKSQDGIDIGDIAAQLQVDHVLEGSVRKAGNRVRITAQLIDVTTDTHLWSETYDRELADIFAIQDEIAARIVSELKLALNIEATPRPTDDLEAYTLYLHGRELLRRRDPEGLLEADRLLAEATDRDPEFADAWASRAMVQVVIPGYLKDEAARFRSPATTYAERALALRPGHPEAMLVLGQVMNVTGDPQGALEQLEATVRQHPGQSTGQLWLAIALAKAGYLNRAFEHVSAARSLDPVHPTVLDWYARIAPLGGAPEQVVPTAERALQLGREQGRVPLFQYFLGAGDRADMARYVDGPDQPGWGWMLEVFEVRDDPVLLPAALDGVDELERQGAGFIVEYMRMNLLLVAGGSEAFFEQLQTVAAVDDTVAILTWLPVSARHRNGQAMRDWAADEGLLTLWTERGWPEFCRPVGDDDFECDG